MLTYLRTISHKSRNAENDRHLAYFLTFVAGAANAGGFMAINQYTSHMSGIISSMADSFVLGNWIIVSAGLGAVVSFIAGAATCAIMVNWGRRLNLHGEYALPLLLEGFLLIVFGVFGANLQAEVLFFASTTILLLCFIMGLQNATVTKLSNSRIRTTHMTGLVTDIGIEIGKTIYRNDPAKSTTHPPVKADLEKLKLLSALVSLFFLGGIIGAYSFQKLGFAASIYLGFLVIVLALMPVFDDLMERRR